MLQQMWTNCCKEKGKYKKVFSSEWKIEQLVSSSLVHVNHHLNDTSNVYIKLDTTIIKSYLMASLSDFCFDSQQFDHY